MEIDQEILDEFHTEAEESLDALEADLITLEGVAEAGDSDPDLIDRLFRVLHTLKGGAGFLGLEKMNKLAHAGENLLDEVRAGNVPITTEVMDALLETNDTLKDLLDCSKTGESPDNIGFKPLADRLDKLSAPGGVAAPEAPKAEEPQTEETATPAVETPEPTGIEINEDLLAEIQADDRLTGPAGDDDAVPTPEAPAIEINEELLAEIQADDRLTGPAGEGDAVPTPAAPAIEINEELLAEIQADDRLTGPAGGDDDIETVEAEPVTPKQEAKKEEPAKPAEQTEQPKAEAFDRRGADRRDRVGDRRKKPGRRDHDPKEVTIRVDTARLDAVMNLVGELVLARNTLVRQMEREDTIQRLQGSEYQGIIESTLESLTRVSKDLQMSVLRTRMQPIKRVFDKIPRQVRELKNKLGKEINLVIEGEGTEVDRSLVEELADPMVHLIRNALDHGLEGPEERTEVGKKPEGTLAIRAFYEGNNVVIQVQDDGRGIDPMRIRAKAVEKGLLTEEAAHALPDSEAIKLIMAAGFSTAETISDVSGRGVGMDVVNDKINKIKGTIELESQFGAGTTVSIYLPLTLAIVQALIVEANDEGFAVPIGTVSEVIQFRPLMCHKVNNEDTIELREEIVPIKYLSELTAKGKKDYTEGLKDKNEQNGYVMIVRDGSLTVGLVIDELLGQEEAVVKSITSAFDYNPAISGATISGDGKVHMILDVPYFMRDIVQKQKSLTAEARKAAMKLVASE